MPIKSFRGQMEDGEQQRLNLKHRDGKIGYRIKKFQAIGVDIFGTKSSELIVKIYSIEQTAVTATIDFSDPTLLGVATYSSHENGHLYPEDQVVVFDNTVFNQDIYVTVLCKQGNAGNYYFELEQMPLSSDEATVATLKNMRTTATQTAG